MKTTLHTDWTVADFSAGFLYDMNDDKGLYGLNGKLVVQPEYQRNYLYGSNGKDVAVVETLMRGLPIGLIYLVKTDEDKYEVLDGQQRITSFARFVSGSNRFAVEYNGTYCYFGNLPNDMQHRIADAPLTVYVCEGTPSEIQDWFRTINIVGIPLNEQELRNAAYHGTFVTAAREVFSNINNSNLPRWQTYVKGNPRRQEILETALEWAGDGDVERYMAEHQFDEDCSDLERHFNSVITWVQNTFSYTGKEMCGRDWGYLYKMYHKNSYNKEDMDAGVERLLGDEQVTDKKGIFEYLLGGETDKSLLNIRVFDNVAKQAAYSKQTATAKAEGASNCPLCAASEGANKARIYKLSEMEADHVAAWSKGGATSLSNCQMLCKTHNHAKGNK